MTDTSSVPDLTVDDLNLVAAQADATKDEEELWNELEAEDEERSSKDDDEAIKAVEDNETKVISADEGSDGGQGDDEGSTSTGESDKASQDDQGTGEGEGAGNEQQNGSEVDIWADAPEPLRTAYQELTQERDAFEHRIKSDNGRVGALQRQVNDLKNNIAKLTKPADADPNAAVQAISGLAEEYPEIAGPLKDIVGTLQAQIDTVKTADDRRQKASDLDTAGHIEVETAALEAEHPGYIEFIKDNGQEFVTWLNSQDDATRATFAKNQEYILDANAASKVIRGFKTHLASKTAPKDDPAPNTEGDKVPPKKDNPQLDSRRQRQLEGSASPASKGRGPQLSGIPESGDEEALWEAWEKHDRANER